MDVRASSLSPGCQVGAFLRALRPYRFGLLQQVLEEKKPHVGPSCNHHRAGVASDCHTAVLLQALKKPDIVLPKARSPAGFLCQAQGRGCLAMHQTGRVHFVTFVGDGFLDGPA